MRQRVCGSRLIAALGDGTGQRADGLLVTGILKVDDGFAGLGVTEFFAREPLDGAGVVAATLRPRLSAATRGILVLLDLGASSFSFRRACVHSCGSTGDSQTAKTHQKRPAAASSRRKMTARVSLSQIPRIHFHGTTKLSAGAVTWKEDKTTARPLDKGCQGRRSH